MLKKLFGIGKQNDPVLAKVEELQADLGNKNFDKVIADGEALIDKVSAKNRPSLIRTLALAYFQNKSYEKANVYFEELCQLEDNPDNWFNLCTSLVLNKEAEKGLDALESAISSYQKKGKRENLPIPYMIYYTLCALVDSQEYNLAFEQLDRMAIVYKQISITDTHFLHTRGYVPFSTILEKAKIILENQTEVDGIEWLNDFASALDEDGQMLIEDMIADIQNEKTNVAEEEKE